MEIPADELSRKLIAACLTKTFGLRSKPLRAEEMEKAAEGAEGVHAALDTLVQAGLLQKSSAKDGASAYSTTAEVAASLKAASARPKKAASATPKKAGASSEVAEQILGALLPRLERIEQQLAAILGQTNAPHAHAAAPSHPAAKPAAHVEVRESDILSAVRTLAATGRYGGLVPIGEVRRAVLGAAGDRAAFDARLLEMERAFRVDLKVANDPTVAGAEGGIHVAGRGLLFYVVAR